MGFGDDLMDSGSARLAQVADPRKVRIVYGHKVPWSEVWEYNPRLARPEEVGDFQLVWGRAPGTNLRPYHKSWTIDQCTYDPDFKPAVGELYLSEAELSFGARYAGRIVVQPHLKVNSTSNKRWPFSSWNKFVQLTGATDRIVQIGAAGVAALDGVEFVETRSFRLACAVIANARAVVLHEGGSHHAAAALGIPGVVIFGGYTPIDLTGYPIHCNLGVRFEGACGRRSPCEHCAREMNKIEPEQVVDELSNILTGARRS